jgi:hypothetical protein
MAVSYSFGDPASGGGTLVVAEGDLASLADWLTDSMRLAGSGGEWSAGDPWSGVERGGVSRAWLHDPESGDPPMRGFRVLCVEGSTVGLQVSTARVWRNDLRNETTRAFSDGVVRSDHIV